MSIYRRDTKLLINSLSKSKITRENSVKPAIKLQKKLQKKMRSFEMHY